MSSTPNPLRYDVTINDEIDAGDALCAAARDALLAALTHAAVAPGAGVSLLLTADAAVHALNHTYRDEDKTTDVLSFPDGDPLWPGGPVYLGDLALSLPQATRQAMRGGHAVSAEIQLLVVHGVLHLLGYDHDTPANKAEMWRAQADILRHLGAELTVPADDI